MEPNLQELEHQLKLLKRCLFGSHSEKVSTEELETRIKKKAQQAAQAVADSKRPDEPPADAEEEKPEPKTQKDKDGKQRKAGPHVRSPLPQHLKRIRKEHPIDPAQNTCPHCPEHPLLLQIGEDIREKLHKLPAQYVAHQHVSPKSVCQRCRDRVVMPEDPDNGLKADITVVADVVVQKYAEHKPLYRQQQAFDRVGIPLRRQTLCDWTGWYSDQVAPVLRAVREYILQQHCVQSDETPLRMQLADGTMQGTRLWAFGLPSAKVVLDFRTSKSHHGPEEWLKGGQTRCVQADDGAMAMRRVRYRDPEAWTRYEFLSSMDDFPPALIALLHLARWRIEKVFDTTKNKLEETKGWAVGATAQDIRAHLVALTHNLLLPFRETLGREHGVPSVSVRDELATSRAG
jgi:transposase